MTKLGVKVVANPGGGECLPNALMAGLFGVGALGASDLPDGAPWASLEWARLIACGG
jgi:hypothetical protein